MLLNFYPCYLSFNLHGYTCTEQVYFVAGTTKKFLSINAYKGLKLIHHNFTYHTVAGAMVVACLTNQSEPSNTVKEDEQSTPSELSCRPEVMPYDATDDNIGKLEKCFLQTFADTVFNIDHPLPNVWQTTTHTPTRRQHPTYDTHSNHDTPPLA